MFIGKQILCGYVQIFKFRSKDQSVRVKEHPGREYVLPVAVSVVPDYCVSDVVTMNSKLKQTSSLARDNLTVISVYLMPPPGDGGHEDLGGRPLSERPPLQHHQPRPRLLRLAPVTSLAVHRRHPDPGPLPVGLGANVHPDVELLMHHLSPD